MSSAAEPCPDREELEAFLLGLAAADRQPWLEAHVGGCAACAAALQRLDGADRLVAAVRDAGADAVPLPPVLGAIIALAKNRADTVTLGAAPTGPGTLVDVAALLEPPAEAGEVGRLGPYRVLDVLGEGGMGVVFRAADPRLNRAVALKVMRPGVTAVPGMRERFLREARAAAQLDHPHIVPIYDIGEAAGRAYFAMALVEGRSLAREVAGGPLAPRRAAGLVRQAADAIACAHRLGVVHRDLKPANILLDAAGRAQVTDFGLAKQGDAGELTQAGQVMGTPGYMPPEQAEGRFGQVGPLADVYALGATLYCLLTARPPFQAATTLETLRQVIDQDPAPPRLLNPAVGRDLDTICLKCLEKRRERRYASAQELADDLGRYLDGRPIVARPVSPLGRLARWARRNPGWAAAVTLLAVGALATTVAAVAAANRFRRLADRDSYLRGQAEDAREQTRRTLYGSQMMVAARAAETSGGVAQLRALVAEWRPQPGKPDLRGWEWRLFRAMTTEELRVIPVGSAVSTVDWSPDGRRLAVAMGSWTDVYDPHTGAGPETWQATPSSARLARWSPDGGRLATAGDRGAEVVDGATGALRRARPHDQPIVGLSWHPDGRRLYLTDRQNRLFAWDVDGEASAAVEIARGVMDAVASPDGTLLAAAERWPGKTDVALRLLDTTTGAVRHRFGGHDQTFSAVAWRPDGRRVAGATSSGVVKVWDARTGDLVWSRPPDGYNTPALAWSPDGRFLAWGNEGQAVRIWDVDADSEVALLRGHDRPIRSLTWSPDGRRLATAAADERVAIWDVARGPAAWTRDLHVRAPLPVYLSVAWSRGGDRLAASYHNQGTSLWDARRGAKLAQLPGVCGCWDRDDTHLATVFNESIYLRAADGTAELRSFEGRGQPKVLAWSPTDRRLAIRGADRVWLWDAAGAGPPAQLWGDPVPPYVPYAPGGGLAWHPDGRRLAFAVARPSGWVLVEYDTRERRVEREFPVGHLRPEALAWSGDGRFLAVAGQDPAIRVVDAASGEAVRTLHGHTFTVHAVAWHPDGTRLASAGEDGAVRVWDARTGDAVFLANPGGAVKAVAWSRDGMKLAALGSDGLLRVWDATRGYEADADGGKTAS